MKAREIVRRLDLPATEEQLRASTYLERYGYRFCCEFGYENAVEKAVEHWRSRHAVVGVREEGAG